MVRDARLVKNPVGAWLCFALSLFLFVAGFPTPVSAQDPSEFEALEGQPIKKIEFQGLKKIPGTRLKQQIRTKEGSTFRADILTKDIHRLYDLGEFQGWIRWQAFREKEGIRIVFKVAERDTVTKVIFKGIRHFGEKYIKEHTALRPGDPLNRYIVNRDLEELRSSYQGRGFQFVEVQADIVQAKKGVEVIYRVHEGPFVTIKEIRFVGNGAYTKKQLLNFMAKTKERSFIGLLGKGAYDADKMAIDLLNVTRFYRSQGYLDARVFVEDEIFTFDWSAVSLVIRVIEGPRYNVGSISVKGTKLYKPKEVLKKIPLKPGATFLHRDLSDSRVWIDRMYADKGYLFNKIDLKLNYPPNSNKVDVVFDVTEGKKITIERIEFRGNYRTRDDVLRRDLSIYPGELFKRVALDESRIRLLRHGWFKRVEIDFEDGTTPNTRDLIIDVEEQKTGNIIFGAGISSDSGFFGRIVINQRNFDLLDTPSSLQDFLRGTAFVGGGQSLNITLEPGGERSRYLISFEEPWLGGKPYLFGNRFSFFQRERGDYLESRLGGNISFGRHWMNQDVVARLVYENELITISDVETDAPSEIIDIAGDSNNASMMARFSVDRQVIAPNRLAYGGWLFDTSYRVSSDVFGGDFDFHRFLVNGNIQWEMFRWPKPNPRMPEPLAAGETAHVLQLRGQFGVQEEFGETDSIPVFERFFAGGPRSIRGFEFRTVGPQENDVPIGGDAIMAATLEYNFPIPKAGTMLRGVTFVDVGQVTRNFKRLGHADDYRISVGVGGRILVPGVLPAPIALDWAWPLQDLAPDDSRRFSFSIDFGF